MRRDTSTRNRFGTLKLIKVNVELSTGSTREAFRPSAACNNLTNPEIGEGKHAESHSPIDKVPSIAIPSTKSASKNTLEFMDSTTKTFLVNKNNNEI